jgi:phage shock protein A
MGSDEKTKLKTLLKYWIEHNQEHSQEFKEWAEKARQMGEGKVAGEILQAVANMEKVTQILSRTLKRLQEA